MCIGKYVSKFYGIVSMYATFSCEAYLPTRFASDTYLILTLLLLIPRTNSSCSLLARPCISSFVPLDYRMESWRGNN